MEDNRHLQFVLRHYREAAFNTRKAIDRFYLATGRPSRRLGKFFAAASAAAAIILGIFMFTTRPQPACHFTADAAGTFVLPDSSTVRLAPYSRIEYDSRTFLRKSRSVKMEGKAFFDVTSNPDNPFEISASQAYIRVLGTSFQVDAASGTEVYVKSGRVLFASSAEAEGVVLTEGMSAVLGLSDAVPQVREAAVPNPAAWATGVFEYDATPLKDVLEELSGFYGVELKASDYDRRLSAKFGTDAGLDEIVEMIAAATEVEISK